MAHHTKYFTTGTVHGTRTQPKWNSDINRIRLSLSGLCNNSNFNNIPPYSNISTSNSYIGAETTHSYAGGANIRHYYITSSSSTSTSNVFSGTTYYTCNYEGTSEASAPWSSVPDHTGYYIGNFIHTSGANVGDLSMSTPYVMMENDHVSGITKEYFNTRAWLYIEYSTPHVTITTSVKDNKGGSVSGAGTYDYNATGIQITATANAGYTFSGWSGTASGMANPLTYSASQLIDAYDASKSFQATFTPNNYTVTFNANGGSVSPTSTTVIFNNTYGTLPTPSRTGYTFDGWYTSIDGETKITSSTTVSITTNQTLYARWIAKTPTVTFDPAGGSVSPSINTVIYGNKYGTLPTPTKTGYTFTGWYYNNTKIESSTKVSVESNHTLIAHWDPIPYTITFVSDNTIIKTTLINYGDKYKDFPTVNKDGYIFNGWKNAVGATITSNSNMLTAENHTLTADWTPFSYTVIFYGNGDNGANSMTQQSFQYHKDQKLTKNAFLKPGYQFIGWNTETDGTGQSFSDEQQMKDFKPNTNGQIIHLYAQWLFAAVHNIKIDNSAVIGVFLDTTRIIKILIDKTIVYTQ